jgi:hypothetical protein
MFDNLIWDELSLEVIFAAKSGIAVKDFEIQCRLAPTANGKSYFDRFRVAEALISDKMICIENGYLKLANNFIPESLVDNLVTGSEVAWKILDCIDPPKKYLQKIDQDLLKKIGLNGELAVIEEIRNHLDIQDFPKVRHISLVDDSAGFDIQTPSIKNIEETLLLEVKTSVRPGDLFTFYISKNEARVARQNNNWLLVGVESFADGFRVFGNLMFNTFSDLLPLNQSRSCEWETAKIVISKKLFFNGLP